VRTCTPPSTANACGAQSLGIFDASTLGKIEVVGPDAAFMELLYTNPWEKLETGRCRYGIMLRRGRLTSMTTASSGASRRIASTSPPRPAARRA
jgi:glycine cleavage system aminomethyltransferase T